MPLSAPTGEENKLKRLEARAPGSGCPGSGIAGPFESHNLEDLAMEKSRGNFPRGATSGRRSELREESSLRMHPERYFDAFFRDMARRVNFTRDLSRRHFEARRFLSELTRFVNGHSQDPPRRA